VRQRHRHPVDLRRVRLGHDADVAAHDTIIVAADTARTSVKNRLPDYGVTMSFVRCSLTRSPAMQQLALARQTLRCANSRESDEPWPPPRTR
jgi:hypothetical protein